MRRLLRVLAVVVALLAMLAGWIVVEGRPRQASPAEYVAMGSSFASGPGITDGAPDSPLFCARSKDNYAHQLARLRGLSLVDVTCGGATTRHVLEGGQLLQPAQLDALRPETRLVTLTIGGNDIAYIGKLLALGCARHTQWYLKIIESVLGCRSLTDAEVHARLQALPAQFDRIAGEVRRRAPDARLVLLTYPAVLPPSGTCDRLGLTAEQADAMRAIALALADVTRAAAARHGALVYDAGTDTAEHGVCGDAPWMTDQQHSVPLHPTLDGMTAVARGLDRMLPRD